MVVDTGDAIVGIQLFFEVSVEVIGLLHRRMQRIDLALSLEEYGRVSRLIRIEPHR